jgi:hypothetical protein
MLILTIKDCFVYIYEKIYLFIAFEPLCILFEHIFQQILNIKKLNFFNNLDNFECIKQQNNIQSFEKENSEIVFYYK